ncbi:uncharacterized protein LOC135369117 [Ornithodoros turicata]|uniref:uncharacterized protein LOC135369117 n=1 Tax=Ornithodoros turicata TaxID=34597 RepID=UPI003139058F
MCISYNLPEPAVEPEPAATEHDSATVTVTEDEPSEEGEPISRNDSFISQAMRVRERIVNRNEPRDGSRHAATAGDPVADHVAARGPLSTPAKRPRRVFPDYVSLRSRSRSISATSRLQEDDNDDDGFVTVVHKKTRKAGIPVVLTPVDPKVSLLNIDPNLIAAQELKSTQERVRNHHFSRNGSLTVTVASLQAAKALLGVTSLGNTAVTTRIPKSYARNVGKIVGVNPSYTNAQLLEYLLPFGAIDARRQVRYRPNPDGSTRTQETSSVAVTFKSDVAMPEEVPLGFNKYKVGEYFSPSSLPGLWPRCQVLPSVGALRACAGSHAFKDCTARKEQRCANCWGPHPASFGGRPKRKAAIAAVKTEACEVRPSRSGRINPAVVKPTRPAPVRSAEAFPALPKPAAPAKKPTAAKPASGRRRQSPADYAGPSQACCTGSCCKAGTCTSPGHPAGDDVGPSAHHSLLCHAGCGPSCQQHPRSPSLQGNGTNACQSAFYFQLWTVSPAEVTNSLHLPSHASCNGTALDCAPSWRS